MIYSSPGGFAYDAPLKKGPAVFVGGWAVEQLWLFWVAPIVGAALAGVVYAVFATEPERSMRKSLSAQA